MLRPRWRIIGERHELVLISWGAEPETSGVRLTPDDTLRDLDALLALAPSRGVSARTLEEAARHVSARHDVTGSFRAKDARAVVAEALARGVLVGWRCPLRLVPAPTPGEFDPEEELSRIPLASSLLRTWIEIELLDMEGNPVPGRRYWIKLPDGTVREGALDRLGRAYFGDLDPGEALIRWPDLDEEATVTTRHGVHGDLPPPPPRTWIEIALIDMEGNPVPREPYVIALPDGQVRRGRLDRHGMARLENLAPGSCKVRFPERDIDTIVPVEGSA